MNIENKLIFSNSIHYKSKNEIYKTATQLKYLFVLPLFAVNLNTSYFIS